VKEHFNNKANAKEGTHGQKLKNIETDCSTGWAFVILLGWTVLSFTCDIFSVYAGYARGWNRSLHIEYLTATHCLKLNGSGLEWQSAGQGQSSIGLEFDFVRLKKCSILERSIVFDWQNVWVSSIMFDCRTQSKSIERLKFDWVLCYYHNGYSSQFKYTRINWWK